MPCCPVGQLALHILPSQARVQVSTRNSKWEFRITYMAVIATTKNSCSLWYCLYYERKNWKVTSLPSLGDMITATIATRCISTNLVILFLCWDSTNLRQGVRRFPCHDHHCLCVATKKVLPTVLFLNKPPHWITYYSLS